MTALTREFLLRPFTVRGVSFNPPLFCAPMAGITHSAFRRLLADFGGYGALFTEMLSAKAILQEDLRTSPWLKRRPQEGKVIYQLLAVDPEGLPETLDRLSVFKPDGIDLNTACPAPTVRQKKGGADLFEDGDRLREIVRVIRRCFAGPLTVKVRLGRQTDSWRDTFHDRLRMLEGEGIDALIIHPRFSEEKLKRSARHSLYAELASGTRLPVIANGDITGAEYVREHAEQFAPAAGLMAGRIVAARPWFFAQWQKPDLAVNHLEVWNRLCDYIAEDFEPHKALMRIKIIAPYFARNFVFGHTFFAAMQSAPDLAAARERASKFLSTLPALNKHIAFDGI